MSSRRTISPPEIDCAIHGIQQRYGSSGGCPECRRKYARDYQRNRMALVRSGAAKIHDAKPAHAEAEGSDDKCNQCAYRPANARDLLRHKRESHAMFAAPDEEYSITPATMAWSWE